MLDSSTYLSIPIFLYLLCIIFVCQNKFSWRFGFLLVFNVVYAVLYCIIPVVIILSPESLFYNSTANWANSFIELNNSGIIIAIIHCFFYVAFISIYSMTYKNRSEVSVDYDNNRVYIVGIFFLALGVISYYLYSLSVGGPIKALQLAQIKRSGMLEVTGITTFFKHFIRIVFISFFMFISTKPNSKGLLFLRPILLITSFIFSILGLVVYSGRAQIIIFLATILLFYAYKYKNRIQWGKIVRFSPTALFVIVFYRPIMFGLGGVTQLSSTLTDSLILETVTRIIKGLSVPYISNLVAINKSEISMIFWGSSYYKMLIDLIPKSILGVDYILNVSKLNTFLFGYEFYSSAYSYEIVGGIVADAYYEFYWLGFLIVPAIIGLILGKLDSYYRKYKSNNIIQICCMYFMLSLTSLVLNGDVMTIFKNNFIFVFGFFVFKTFCKRKVINNG